MQGNEGAKFQKLRRGYCQGKRGWAKFLGGKYISQHGHYRCYLIAVTFQVMWWFSTF